MKSLGWVAAGRYERLCSAQRIPSTVVEWIEFAEELGIRVVWGRLPFAVHAVRLGDTIVIHQGLNESDETEALLHEIAHRLLHAGNMMWWQSLPMGERILAKQERQADELSGLLSGR